MVQDCFAMDATYASLNEIVGRMSISMRASGKSATITPAPWRVILIQSADPFLLAGCGRHCRLYATHPGMAGFDPCRCVIFVDAVVVGQESELVVGDVVVAAGGCEVSRRTGGTGGGGTGSDRC